MRLSRRQFLQFGIAGGALAGWALAAPVRAVTPLEVAYAGSMAAVMTGPLRAAALRRGWDLRGRAQGATALAELIAGGSLHPDVFISITASPVRRVQDAGKSGPATAFATTAMTLAYNPRGRWANALRRGPWWQVLQRPGFRLGRSDPRADPQGRNIIFTCLLAEAHYRQPGLAHKLLGDWTNPAQIYSESTLEARLQSGQLDAVAAYSFQPAAYGMAALALPEAINLSSLAPASASLRLEFGSRVYHPEALVFFATALRHAPHPAAAPAFLAWLTTPEAQAILRQAGYGRS